MAKTFRTESMNENVEPGVEQAALPPLKTPKQNQGAVAKKGHAKKFIVAALRQGGTAHHMPMHGPANTVD